MRYRRRTEAEGSPVEGLCVVEGLLRDEDIDVRDAGDHLVFCAGGLVKAMATAMAMAMVEGEKWRRGNYLFVPRSGRDLAIGVCVGNSFPHTTISMLYHYTNPIFVEPHEYVLISGLAMLGRNLVQLEPKTWYFQRRREEFLVPGSPCSAVKTHNHPGFTSQNDLGQVQE